MCKKDNDVKYFSAAEKDSFAEFTANNRFERIYKSYCSGDYEKFLDKTLAGVFPVLSDEYEKEKKVWDSSKYSQNKDYRKNLQNLLKVKVEKTQNCIDNSFNKKVTAEPIKDPYVEILQDFLQCFDKIKKSNLDTNQSEEFYSYYYNKAILSPLLTMRDILRFAPFLEAEFIFYHAILAEKEYSFDQNGFDFYAAEKKDSVMQGVDKFIDNLDTLVSNKKDDKEDKRYSELSHKQFSEALLYCLSANTSDLSQLNSKARVGYKIDDMNILHDDSDELYEYLVSLKKRGEIKLKLPCYKRRCDIICDNAGKELFSDLYLACYFLYNKIFDKVVFHLKEYPFFVSDATMNDFGFLIKAIQQEGHRRGAEQCLQYIREKKIIIKSNKFWTRPLCFKDMKENANELYSDICSSNLIIVKGDLNYRRLVEDADWSYTSTFDERTSNVFIRKTGYPVPILAPRVLKSDVLIGISDAAYHYAKSTDILNAPADQRFKGSGKWAVIHFRHCKYKQFKKRSVDRKAGKYKPKEVKTDTTKKESKAEKKTEDPDVKTRKLHNNLAAMNFGFVLILDLVMLALLFVAVLSLPCEVTDNGQNVCGFFSWCNRLMKHVNPENVKRIDFSLLLSGYMIFITGTLLVPRYFLRQETKVVVEEEFEITKNELQQKVEDDIEVKSREQINMLNAKNMLLDGDWARMTAFFLQKQNISLWSIGWAYHSLRRYLESECLMHKDEMLGFLSLNFKTIIVKSLAKVLDELQKDNGYDSVIQQSFPNMKFIPDDSQCSRFAGMMCRESEKTGEPDPRLPILRLIKDSLDFEYEIRYKSKINHESEFYHICDEIIRYVGLFIRYVTLNMMSFPIKPNDHENFNARCYPTTEDLAKEVLRISSFQNDERYKKYLLNTMEYIRSNLFGDVRREDFPTDNETVLAELYKEENKNYRTYFFIDEEYYRPLAE